MNIFKKEMPDVVKDNRLEYDYCGGLPEFKYFDRNIKKQVNGYSVISVYMTDAKLYDISCYSSERPKDCFKDATLDQLKEFNKALSLFIENEEKNNRF